MLREKFVQAAVSLGKPGLIFIRKLSEFKGVFY